MTKYTSKPYTKTNQSQTSQRMYCTRCKRYNRSQYGKLLYEHGFPPNHKLHGIDFNKTNIHQRRDNYNKGGRYKDNFKGKHQSYNATGKGSQEEDHKDTNKDASDKVYITRDELNSIMAQEVFNKNGKAQAPFVSLTYVSLRFNLHRSVDH